MASASSGADSFSGQPGMSNWEQKIVEFRLYRFHDLRHTFATLALQNGVDVKTVSSMLGHYDAGFTLRTYTHATRQKQDEAAQTMGSFMAQVM